MERNLPSYEEVVEEEDYIDMDVSSTTFLCYTVSSPLHSKEFEFQLHVSSNPPQREDITSPADELFYNGKLVPLHLPPRLQLVQKLFENNTTISYEKDDINLLEETTVMTPAMKDSGTTTLFESCNISPATSCYVSRELTPEEYLHECSAQLVHSNQKKSWCKKLKLIRQFSFNHKLRASRAYLKSLFTRSCCSTESSAVGKNKKSTNSFLKGGKKNQCGQIQKERHQVAETNATSTEQSIRGEEFIEEEYGHWKSFSGIIKWNPKTKSSSTSSPNCSSFASSCSSGLCGPQVLRSSSSVNSEAENSIQGAIAYCKMSQQLIGVRKSVSDSDLYSTVSRIAAACGTAQGMTNKR